MRLFRGDISRVASKVRGVVDQLPMPRRAPKTPNAPPAKGLYSNYFEVGQTAFEVVIDFGQTYEGTTPMPCHTRIVTSPIYARALLRTLSEALEAHQGRFGEI